MAWGSDTNNESKPDWTHLQTRQHGTAEPLKNKVHATKKGWAIRRPWGDEVIVAIGGLDTNLGTATMAELSRLLPESGSIANTAAQAVRMLVQFNEAVTVTGTPTMLLLGAAGASNVALAYNASLSEPSAGRLVFANANFSAAAMTVGGTLTANASSVLTGWANILDAGSAAAVANVVVGSASVSVAAA